MAKEIIHITPKEMGDIEVTNWALEAYNFARSIPVDLDEEALAEVIAKRNLRSVSFRDLHEFRKALERLVKDIKETEEFVYNLGGPESLPEEGEDGVKISWSKQSYTPKWAAIGCSAKVVRTLSKKGILNVDDALCELTVDAVIRASGLTKDKLIAMFPEDIVEEPKKRTLSIK